MGLMTFLRQRAGLLIGAIGFAIVAFLVGDAITAGRPFWEGSQRVVGSIDGEDIEIEQFSAKVEQSMAQFRQQYGSSNPQMTAMAVENVWQGEIANVLLNKEYNRLGLIVSDAELKDLISGTNLSPVILQNFGNPQTGEINRAEVINTLKQASKDPRAKQQLDMLEAEIERQALQQKYSKVISNSIYVTSLEAIDEHNNRNKLASFRYVSLDYTSVPDASIKLTDGDYSEFYNEHKNEFLNPSETRSFEYVAFSVNPTKEDSLNVKNQVNKLAAEFRTTANDSLFSALNSDVKVPYTFLSKGKLDASVDSALFSLPAGSFYGPVFSGNSYKLAKVVATRMSPDSVKASHILLDPARLGGVDKAKKMADSLKNLVAGGANFATLAPQYSVDGSKDQGGDLGTFSRGQMVPEFENAAFDGKPGDLKVVTSQFGVHLIKIQSQVGSSKVAKIAYIEKNLISSNKTKDAAYRKASNFLNEVKSDNFKTLAQKQGYTVGIADNVTANQGFAPGLDNPRQVIRDAFAADGGEILKEVYQMDNAYVVARLTSIRPKGILSLEAIKNDIESRVRNAVKAKMLKEKMDKALNGSKNIEQVAQKLSKQPIPVQNLVFANPILPGAAQENVLVGTVFGSQAGKISSSIEGQSGVFAFVVDGFTSPAPLANTFKQKEMMMQAISQRALGSAFQALQDKSDIKDNRVKFY